MVVVAAEISSVRLATRFCFAPMGSIKLSTCKQCGSITAASKVSGMAALIAALRSSISWVKRTLWSLKTPTQNWIVAIYMVLTARKGVSAMQLSKELGVQYRTAWHMLHRIREACQQGDPILSNVVEVDEVYISSKERNKHERKKRKAGRGTAGKTPVIGARERDGKVAAKPREGTDARSLIRFRRNPRRARRDRLHRRRSSLCGPAHEDQPVSARNGQAQHRGIRSGRRAYQLH